jgi:hypothetical protein
MISTETKAFQRRTNAFLNNSAKLYPKPKSTDLPSILQWTTPQMGSLLSITTTRARPQGAELRVHRPGRKPKHLRGRVSPVDARRGCSRAAAYLSIDGTPPMVTTYFSGTMPILRRRGLFLLICAKRILNRRVAAAIAYLEEQESPASTGNWNAPNVQLGILAHAYSFCQRYRQQNQHDRR